MSHLLVFKDTRQPLVSSTIRLDGSPYDLSDAGVSVVFKMRALGSSDTDTLKVNATAQKEQSATTVSGAQVFPSTSLTVADASGFLESGSVVLGDGQVLEYNGRSDTVLQNVRGGVGTISDGATVTQIGGVSYAWAAGDVDTEGFYLGWWAVTLAVGQVVEVEEFLVEIREHGQEANWLCEIEDVKLLLAQGQGETVNEAAVRRGIERASHLVQGWCRREFRPKSADDTLRIVRLYPARSHDGITYNVDLSPYDLRAASLIRLHPEAAAPLTLASGIDYVLEPEGAPLGAYGNVLVSKEKSMADSGSLGTLGYAQLEITGNWGFDPVPADVVEACAAQVANWVRRRVQAFSTTISPESGRIEIPQSLDAGVRSILRRYQRSPFA